MPQKDIAAWQECASLCALAPDPPTIAQKQTRQSRIKSALVDLLIAIGGVYPEQAQALGRIVLRLWPGFRDA